MRTYRQKVRFEREFVIEAKDAAQANEKLDEAIREAEWSSDLANEGYYAFEDDPVECPDCDGNGVIGEDETCKRCNGDGSIPFTA